MEDVIVCDWCGLRPAKLQATTTHKNGTTLKMRTCEVCVKKHQAGNDQTISPNLQFEVELL